MTNAVRLSAACVAAILGALLNACAPAVSAKSTAAGSPAAVVNGDKENGKLVFQANCATCHGATGVEGGVVGPSLRSENARMDYAATVSWIEDPQPPMPHLYPKVLTAQEVRDVAAYVESL